MFGSGRKFIVIAALAVMSLAFVVESANAQLLRGRLRGRERNRGGEYYPGYYSPDYNGAGYYGAGYYNMPVYTAADNSPDAGQFNFAAGTSGYYSPSNSMNSRSILVQLRVPPNAQVWFDGNATQQTGEYRAYMSPPVDSDKPMHYEVRATWTDANGQKVEKTRSIAVRAGHRSLVDFMRPEGAGKSSQLDSYKEPLKNPKTDEKP